MSISRKLLLDTLEQGAVYYIPQWWITNGQNHFFVVMNKDPKSDITTLAYVVTSQVEKVELRVAKLRYPEETMVYIRKGTRLERKKGRFCFDKCSVVNCNSCKSLPRKEFESATKTSSASYAGRLPMELLAYIIKGASMSPVLNDSDKRAMGAVTASLPVRPPSRSVRISVSPLPRN